jgi:hypothetical protein
MVIAVISMRMMEMAVDQVVNVIAMGDLWVPAVGTVDVSLVVPTAVMIGRAAVRIRGIDFQHVIFNLIAAHVLQMPVLQVVGVAQMADGEMATARAVVVAVTLMLGLSAHADLQT